MKHLHVLITSAMFLPAASLFAQDIHDATIEAYVGHRHSCDGSLTPVLRISNTGTVAMSSCVIDIWKNGIQESSFDWQLAIAAEPGETRQPVLPLYNGVVASDVFQFRIISVNDEPDEVEEGNIIEIVVGDGPWLAEGYEVVVGVQTSDAPEGTVWKITDTQGVPVAQGGPYTDAVTVYEVPVLLDPSTCYQLEVSDPSSIAQEATLVAVFNNGETVVELAMAPGAELREGLLTGTVAGMGGHESMEGGLRVFPNPASASVELVMHVRQRGVVSIDVLDATGRLVFTQREGMQDGAPITLDLSDLRPGQYVLRVQGVDGLVSQERLILVR